MKLKLGRQTILIHETATGVQVVVIRSVRMENLGVIAQLVEKYGFSLVALIVIAAGLYKFLPVMYRNYEEKLEKSRQESMDLLRKQANDCEHSAQKQADLFAVSLQLVVNENKTAMNGIVEKLEKINGNLESVKANQTNLATSVQRLETQIKGGIRKARQEK